MQSKEREEVVYKMKRELEEVATLADSKDEYFIDLSNPNPVHTQFKLWRTNLMVPLTDQLEEHAERKLQEAEDRKLIEANKDMAFFKAPGSESQLYDIDAQRKENERKQAALRQALAQEQGVKLDDEELQKIKEAMEGKDDPYEDTVDKLPVKRPKQKWRLF